MNLSYETQRAGEACARRVEGFDDEFGIWRDARVAELVKRVMRRVLFCVVMGIGVHTISEDILIW